MSVSPRGRIGAPGSLIRARPSLIPQSFSLPLAVPSSSSNARRPHEGTDFRTIGDGTRTVDGELGVATDRLSCYLLTCSTMTGSSQLRERGRAIAWYLCKLYVVPLLQQRAPLPKGCQASCAWDEIFARWCVCVLRFAGCAPRRPTRWRTRLAVRLPLPIPGDFFGLFSAGRVSAGWVWCGC